MNFNNRADLSHQYYVLIKSIVSKSVNIPILSITLYYSKPFRKCKRIIVIK